MSVSDYLRIRETSLKKHNYDLSTRLLPQSSSSILDEYPEPAYCGQFNATGEYFYVADRNFLIHVYETKDPSNFIKKASINAMPGNWTITDMDVSRDNRFMIYSSISPTVYLMRLDDLQYPHIPINFTATGNYFGIWSICLSNDGKQILAGSNVTRAADPSIFILDIETKSTVFSINGHHDDVNSVCYADPSSQIFYTASDDTVIKIWDTRRPTTFPIGKFTGHLEGITHISASSDGRYCLSNSKDQTMKLWDIRKKSDGDGWFVDLRCEGFDYRTDKYPTERKGVKHPDDNSVVTYTGHKVLSTLVRCYFSPVASTGERFVYTGSADGKIRIFPIEGGDPIRVLKTIPGPPVPVNHPYLSPPTNNTNQVSQNQPSTDETNEDDPDQWEDIDDNEDEMNDDNDDDFDYDEDDADWITEDSYETSSDDSDIGYFQDYFGVQGILVDGRTRHITRDVAWHPYLPVIVATNWVTESSVRWEASGCISRHEWSL